MLISLKVLSCVCRTRGAALCRVPTICLSTCLLAKKVNRGAEGEGRHGGEKGGDFGEGGVCEFRGVGLSRG